MSSCRRGRPGSGIPPTNKSKSSPQRDQMVNQWQGEDSSGQKTSPAPQNMRLLQLVKTGLFLLPFLLLVSTVTAGKARSPSFSLIQTPLSLNVSEGSDVTLNCRINGTISEKWFIKWINQENKTLKNSTQIWIFKNDKTKSTNLTLKAIDVADSGIYRCFSGNLDSTQLTNGTEVTVWERPNVVVNQNPGHFNGTEGANVTILCKFRRVKHRSLIEVKWQKDGKEFATRNPSGRTLTLMDAKVEDSGNYVCTVNIRNRTGSGNGTWVHITAGGEKPPENVSLNIGGGQQGSPVGDTWSGVAVSVGAGVAGGTVVFLSLLFVWLCGSKRKSKETPGSSGEADVALPEETRKNTPLDNQVESVTYADLQFRKRELQPDEVVYAEVKKVAKSPGGKD